MFEGHTILAVVPARGGSKGIPLKNIYPLGGKPLVAWTAETVRKLDFIDRAVVSTDHLEIVRVASANGLPAPFMRPETLSGDRIADWDVLNHALLEMERQDGRRYDVVVMLQPTSPFRRPEHVRDTVALLFSGGFDAVWTVSQTDSKAHPLKQLCIRNGLLDYYDPAGAKIVARQQLEPVYHRNGVAYAIRRSCLVERRSIKGERTGAVVIREPLVNIDGEDDIRYAEFILSRPATPGQE
jgi:CMP-N-acetylneuraminic acid synthetase